MVDQSCLPSALRWPHFHPKKKSLGLLWWSPSLLVNCYWWYIKSWLCWISFVAFGYFVDCSEALGMESRKIKNSQLKSSRSFPGFSPSEGRLNNVKAWCARFSTAEVFLEIDLLEVRHVSALATQGFKRRFFNYVKTFNIRYSYDGKTWFDYQDDNGGTKVWILNFGSFLFVSILMFWERIYHHYTSNYAVETENINHQA